MEELSPSGATDRTPDATARKDAPVDRLGRRLRDLRVSVTDRCNFRCPYCMPKEIFGRSYTFLPRAEILSFEEITIGRSRGRSCDQRPGPASRSFGLTVQRDHNAVPVGGGTGCVSCRSRMPGVPNPFPSLKARATLRLLQAELGYAVVGRAARTVGWQRKDGRS